MDIKQTQFMVVPLSGSAYEMGQMQAQMVCSAPGWLEFFRSAPQLLPVEQVTALMALYQRHCPGVVEEIQGFADGIELPAERILYYAGTYLRAGHCSHLVVLPQASADAHVLVGRSYEFNDQQEDFRLCITRPAGRYAHIGTSTMLFGRNEGMNEHGLVVTTSGGGMPVGSLPGMRAPLQDGFQFWALVRALLENCRTTDEALAWLREFPMGGNPILLLADRSGQAALVEMDGPHLGVRTMDGTDGQGVLFAANHFTTPEMQPYRGKVMGNSLVRSERMGGYLAEKAPHITREDLRTLFSARYPQGLTCHYYAEFFGTLRSMIFDAHSGDVEICFGSPQANEWRRYHLASPVPFGVFPCALPQESAAPDFWTRS